MSGARHDPAEVDLDVEAGSAKRPVATRPAAARRVAFPIVALALVSGVLWVQLAHGGGSFEPLRPPDPCAELEATSRATGIEGLTERLVLHGVQDAACRVGVSREQLVLDLADSGDPTDAQVEALRQGLLGAVDQMAADGTLPQASDLLDQVLDRADLDPFAAAIIGHLPDDVVDDVVATDQVLARAIDRLDVGALLREVDDRDAVERRVQAAVEDAVREELAEPTDTQLDGLRDGLQEAVPAMVADGSLPPSSDFLDDALEQADLDPFAAAIISHLPPEVVDDIVAIDQVLARLIEGLDLGALLRELDDQDAVRSRVLAAVEDAVREELAEPTDTQLDDLRDGLHEAVPAMVADDSLPPSSDFLDDALDRSDLNPLAELAIRRLPDSLINDVIPSDDVLDRVIDKLDLRAFLQNVDDQDALEDQVDEAVKESVRDELTSKVTDLI